VVLLLVLVVISIVLVFLLPVMLNLLRSPALRNVLKKSRSYPAFSVAAVAIIVGLFLGGYYLIYVYNPAPVKEAPKRTRPQITSDYFIVGPVKAIDKSAKKVTVLDTKTGRDFTIVIPSDLIIFKDNLEASFADISVGELISVYSDQSFDEPNPPIRQVVIFVLPTAVVGGNGSP
jgi:hypothetical protein